MILIFIWVIPFLIFWGITIAQVQLERKEYKQTWKEYFIDITVIDALLWVVLTIMTLLPFVAWIAVGIILGLGELTIFNKISKLMNIKLSDLRKKK